MQCVSLSTSLERPVGLLARPLLPPLQPQEVDLVSVLPCPSYPAPHSVILSRPGPSSLSCLFPQSIPKSMLQGELSSSTAECTGCQGKGESCVNDCVLIFQFMVAIWGVKGFRIDQKNPQTKPTFLARLGRRTVYF